VRQNYANLRGTISVTSFPISYTRWFAKTDTADFPDSIAEATYIAARFFLQQSTADFPLGNLGQQNLTIDTDFLGYLQHDPATYILGDDSFWPVREETPPHLPFRNEAPIVPWAWYVLISGFIGLALYHFYRYGIFYLPHGGSLSKCIAGSHRPEDLLEDYFLLVGTKPDIDASLFR